MKRGGGSVCNFCKVVIDKKKGVSVCIACGVVIVEKGVLFALLVGW